ncbi:hypothetical protein [Pandoraea sp. NPDC090278]|uniref:hypothetical protein n=1 Tax=Pandoraea sp. NPDC090278 TaxID=3364391 RepID=UPI00383A6A34
MYENLKPLQPKGIPLLEDVVPLQEPEIAAIVARLPGIPNEYLVFLKEVGVGVWKDQADLSPYYFPRTPEDAARDHFKDTLIYEEYDGNPGAFGTVWIFAYDCVGTGYGFDSGDNWKIVEIDTTRTITRLELSFRRFVEGLLVCYPLIPTQYSDGTWVDLAGDSHSV